MHSAVLLRNQVAELQAANKAATRRKSHKRKRVQKKGTLTIEEGAQLTALKAFGARGNSKKGKKRARADKGEQTQRRCRRCHKTGHNARTCKSEVDTTVD
jgi:cytochrome c2